MYALVTGASKGIGRACALELAKQGFDIAIHYHSDEQGAQDTLTKVSELGVQAKLIQFDTADTQKTKLTLDEFIASFGGFYCVVLNAGSHNDAPLAGMVFAQWQRVMDVNLTGFYNVVQPCLMPMIKLRKGGRIIAITSVAGETGNAGQTNYSAAKAGVTAACKSLALELASRKITVNCVAPGFIATDMTDSIADERVQQVVPLNRMGKVDEVASLVGYLASDAAAYITKQVIRVDGGI